MFIDNIEKYPELSERLRKQYSEHCDVCHGKGLIDSNKGCVFCNCIKKANVTARLICNGLPKKFLKNHDFINLDSSIITTLNDYCDNIDENIFDGNNLLLINDSKSMIMQTCSTIANKLAFKRNHKKQFYNILLVSFEDVLQELNACRNNYDQKNKLNKILNSVDILFLNFIGDEMDNRSEQNGKFLTDLFAKRSFSGLLNIASTSLTMEEMANKYGVSFINNIQQDFNNIKLNNDGKKETEQNEWY